MDSTYPIGRRRALSWIGGATLLLVGGGAGLLAGRRSPPVMRASRHVMGTRATVLLGGVSGDAGTAILDRAFDALHQVDRLMSRFRADSDIGRINGRPGAWHTVNPHSAHVLNTGLSIARACDGFFDPCLDSLVSQWGFHDRIYPEILPRSGKATPRSGKLITGGAPVSEAFRPKGGHYYRGLSDRPGHNGGRQFRLARPGLGIDLGGIAKGFAIDLAVEQLRAAGVKSALVNVGDDIRAVGSHPSGGPWRIGVRHPRRANALVEVLNLRNQAVATSGDYENFFERDGMRHAHVLDPRKAAPARHHRSFSVVAPTAMVADALATAAFAAPPATAKALLRRLGEGPWLAVDSGGRIYRS